MAPLERWLKLAEVMPIEGKPQWYRTEDCTYTPWEGERWSGTYLGEDDDLVDYVPADEDGDGDEDKYGEEDEYDYEGEEDGEGDDGAAHLEGERGPRGLIE